MLNLTLFFFTILLPKVVLFNILHRLIWTVLLYTINVSRGMHHGNWNINPIDCLQVRGVGDVVTETNSNEHLRLNSFELRSILKVNNSTKLCNVNFNCSNLVNSLSINNFCKPLLKQTTIILEKGNNSLNSYKLRNIRNTFRKNFVTIDNNYSSPVSETPRLVQNNGDLPLDKRKSRPFATLRQPSSLPNFDFNK